MTPGAHPPLPGAKPDTRESDLHQLRVLAMLHFVAAALAVVAIGFLALHFTLLNTLFGAAGGPTLPAAPPPPPEALAMFRAFRWFYLLMAVPCFLGIAGNLASGLALRRHHRRKLSLVVSGLNCMIFPIGTALGIFTFVVLLRQSVMDLYVQTGRTPAADLDPRLSAPKR